MLPPGAGAGCPKSPEPGGFAPKAEVDAAKPPNALGAGAPNAGAGAGVLPNALKPPGAGAGDANPNPPGAEDGAPEK
jgi:hypothetical protein